MSNNDGFQYLDFTKKERRGTILLILIMVLIIFFPEAYVYFFTSSEKTGPEILKKLTLLNENDGMYAEKQHYLNTQIPSYETKPLFVPFEFDPNTINERQWKQLGLNEKTISTIIKYLSKGGRFRHPEDLKKIWGIPQKIADTLIPYIRISATNEQEFKLKKGIPNHRQSKEVLDLNSADSAALEALPGIGPALAHRIIAYRVRIWGYYQTEQLREVWGLRDSLYDRISHFFTANDDGVKKADINTAAIDDLKSHPYFGYRVAQSIVEYRNQHGFYNSLEDVQKIVSIDEENFKKISHYLIIKK